MKRKLLVAALAGGLTVSVPTAIAHPRHTSCGAFGQEHVAADAKALRPSGRLVSQFAPLSAHIAADHAALCD